MSGLINRVRRFVDGGGRPTVLGFHAVGDAHTCTNPLYGRGCSLALVQAVLLAEALADHPGDAVERRSPTRRAAPARWTPWFEASVQMDRWAPTPGAASAAAARRAAKAMAAVFVAAATDPIIGRAWPAPEPALLARGPDGRRCFLARMAEVMADPEAYPVRRSADGSEPHRAARAPRLEGSCGMTERTVTTNGVDLHVTEGPEDGPVVLLAHGFPELGVLVAAPDARRWPTPATGVAPDMRGYGRTPRPEAIRTTTSTT